MEPFRQKGITHADITAAAALAHTALFTVQDGQVFCRKASENPAAATYFDILQKFAQHLPDMRIVVNLLDEPRVLLGKPMTQQCICTSIYFATIPRLFHPQHRCIMFICDVCEYR